MRIRPKKSGSETEQKSPDADPTLCLLADSNVGKILTILTLTPKKYISNFANNFLLNFISFLFLQETSVYDKNWTKNTFFIRIRISNSGQKDNVTKKYDFLSYQLLPYCRQKQYKQPANWFCIIPIPSVQKMLAFLNCRPQCMEPVY